MKHLTQFGKFFLTKTANLKFIFRNFFSLSFLSNLDMDTLNVLFECSLERFISLSEKLEVFMSGKQLFRVISSKTGKVNVYRLKVRLENKTK